MKKLFKELRGVEVTITDKDGDELTGVVSVILERAVRLKNVEIKCLDGGSINMAWYSVPYRCIRNSNIKF